MKLRCARCGHLWSEDGDDRICPACYTTARRRAAREKGPGTSDEVARARCMEKGCVGEEAYPLDGLAPLGTR